ncbi:MAG: diacylglycerol kinase family protein, partial [Clostridia bacterium]|nr:diacylglycerol kinase family protein [Clostridia bacterium]
MKYIFIVNPKAGAGENEKTVRAAIENLPQKENCEIYLTKAQGDAMNFVSERSENEKDERIVFVACGGDGTINEVMNGAAGHENAAVTCFPCGSGNDFVKCFENKNGFLDLSSLLEKDWKKIDLLKVGNRFSANVTNFGFDTTVAITINKEREKTGHGNKNAYTKGIVTALIKSMKNECTVIADGETLNPDGKLLLCTAANGQYVGGSFRCAPRAKLDDGLMEVCLIKPISRLRFVKILKPYTAGEHIDNDEMKDIVVYRQAKKVEVIAKPGFAYSLDGEIIH